MRTLYLILVALLVSCISFATPLPITGPTGMCVGSTVTLTDATPGGTWSCSSTAYATIGSLTGVVTGIFTGVVTITYTVGGTYVTSPMTIAPLPAPISGPASVCAGDTILLSDATPGGVWSSSSITVGYIGLSGFIGVAAGTTNITYSLGTGCATSVMITVNPAPPATIGASSVCVGSSTMLTDAAPGGTWSSSIPTDGTIDPVSGVFTGISAGTTLIHYTLITGCSNVTPLSVYPLPPVYTVTGGGSFCAGGSGVPIGLSGSSVFGVTYQLYDGSTPVGTPVGGTGATISFGSITTPGTYTVEAALTSTGCSATMSGSVTVIAIPTITPTVAITALPATICVGSSDTLTTSVTGGGSAPVYQWHINSVPFPGASSSTFIYGSFTGGDSVAVQMTSSAACTTISTVTDGVVISVDVPTVTATASGPACGGTITLSAGGAVSYSWAPGTGLSCSACSFPATTPTGSLTYSVTGTDAFGCTSTASALVDGNNISGHIIYSGGLPTDSFKIWLIQFNPSDSSIAALDSVNSCMDVGVPYYEFMDPVAGNYLVKTIMYGTVPGTSGYIPTYCTSTPNWYSAASLSHASSADIMDVTMVYGTIPPGPGFIAGYVYSGAGKGTSGDVPAEGMLIYLKDASGNIITYTYTDATGAYYFNSIANGSYIVYPEDYKYYTTPSAIITLSPTNEIAGSIDFKRHTTFGTITPNPTKLVGVSVSNTPDYFPNPTSGLLNIYNRKPISGGANIATSAEVLIQDVTGTIVNKIILNFDNKHPYSQIDFSFLANGIYFITYRCNELSYTGKLIITR